MPTTPSGLSLEEAEALSRKQQADLYAGLPAEGGFFQMPAGEGANKLFQRRGTNIVALEFDYPDDWGGRTIGDFQADRTSEGIAALGLSNVPLVNAADIAGLIKQGQLSQTSTTDLQKFVSESQAYAASATPSPLTPPVSPKVPEAITPEGSLAGIRTVFGPNWQPSPAFTPELQAKGIYGAVRVAGTNDVYTIGKGGTLETPESFMQKFGTLDQTGIVGEITKEQAAQLGINLAGVPSAGDTGIGDGTGAGAGTGTGTGTGNITVDQLGDQTKIDIPDLGGTGAGDADAVVAGAGQTTKSIQDYIKLLEGEDTEAKTELDKQIEQFKTTLAESEGRGAAQLAAEEEQKVQQKKDALLAVNNQIQTKIAEFNQLQAQLQELSVDVEGRPITMASIIGSQSQIQNKLMAQKNSFAADVGLLQAQALALQGQVNSAQAAADRAVDLKYADIDTRLNNQATLIDLMRDQLSDEEQTRLQAIELYLQDKKERLDEQKQNEKDIENMALSVVGLASQDVVNQIRNAKDIFQAAQLAAPYLDANMITPSGEIITKQYIRLEGTNEVYDTSTGSLVHMTAEEFAAAGSPWAQVQVVKELPTGVFVGGGGGAEWSEPYMLGGDWVQKNLITGQIKTAVNVPADGGGDGSGGLTVSQQKKNLQSVLEKELSRLYKDEAYGREGAREKLLAYLQGIASVQFPGLVGSLPDLIYGTPDQQAIIPDDYVQYIQVKEEDEIEDPFK
jgi:hypothetical protein